MNKVIVILEKTKNGGYSAYLPDLPGCVATSSSLEIAKERIGGAVKFHIEGMMKEGLEIPEPFRNSYDLEYTLDIITLFDWFSGILTKSGVSRITGLNQSLINQYALGIKTPSEKQAKKIEKALHNLGHELLEIQLK